MSDSAHEEHLATRCAAGLFDFSFMALYEFSGQRDLQALQTRDLATLTSGRIAYTLLLKEEGAVLIDATVWRLDGERFWLFTGKPIALPARNRSGEHAIFALQGPASGRILARLVGRDAVLALRYFHFLERGSMLIGRLGYSGELGYEFLVPTGEASLLREKLIDAGRGERLRECGWGAADSLRIEAGYVLFDREIDGRAGPRELGLERLVDDTARRGERSRRLVGLEIIDGAAGPDLPAAEITSECSSPTLGKPIALGFAASQLAPGAAVRIADGRCARIARLPFYDPQRRRPRARPL